MAIHEGAPRALRLARRMDRLGLPSDKLARMADVDRETVTRARAGHARSTTYGKLEAALDAFEAETGADQPDESWVEVNLPDGAVVVFKNVSVEFLREFLASRNPENMD